MRVVLATLLIALMVSMAPADRVAADVWLPEEELCRVEPRSQEEIDELSARIPSGRVEVNLSEGRSATPEEMQIISDLLVEFVACHNVNDLPRQAALLTDEGLARGLIGNFPYEWPDELQIRFEGVYAGYMFEDGRLGAVVVGSTPGEFAPLQTFFAFFKFERGQWLIDDVPPTSVLVEDPVEDAVA